MSVLTHFWQNVPHTITTLSLVTFTRRDILAARLWCGFVRLYHRINVQLPNRVL